MIKHAGVDFELWFNGARYSDERFFETRWDEGAHVAAEKEWREGDWDLGR
jgi:hypothetical protein